MQDNRDFTTGRILTPLIRFMAPIFFAMLLQAMYGAVDLVIVGQFASSSDVSAVSTGSQMMMTITNLVTSFAMGTTILLGQRIGKGRGREGGAVVGSSICLFGTIAVGFTVLVPLLCRPLSAVMNAPEEAFDATAAYIRICGLGSLFIIAYNLIGSIFRGIGDSRTPLMTVLIACVCNIAGNCCSWPCSTWEPPGPLSPPYLPRRSASSYRFWSSAGGPCPSSSAGGTCASTAPSFGGSPPSAYP